MPSASVLAIAVTPSSEIPMFAAGTPLKKMETDAGWHRMPNAITMQIKRMAAMIFEAIFKVGNPRVEGEAEDTSLGVL